MTEREECDRPAATVEAMVTPAELLRLRKIAFIAARIVKSIRYICDGGGPTDSGAFVSKAMARDLKKLLADGDGQ